MRDRRMILVIAALVLTTLAVRHPTASIRIITHDRSDPSPHRMVAAVDLGMVGVKVLYTWTVGTLAR